MGILQKLLSEIGPKKDEVDKLEGLRTLCDSIFEQEKDNNEHAVLLPKGPNIFLSLEVPGRITGEIAFLSLERESEDLYLAVLFTTNKKELAKVHSMTDTPSIKRQRVWEINDSRPEQILTAYAKRYKFLRGE